MGAICPKFGALQTLKKKKKTLEMHKKNLN
jgi:hypothetical protein